MHDAEYMVTKTAQGFIVKGDGLVHQEYLVQGNYQGILFGPELELFVVDKETFKPKNCLDALAGHAGFGKTVKPELSAEQIEIIVPPSASLKDLEQNLLDVARSVGAILKREHAALLPISLFDTAEFTITPNPRYDLLIQTLGKDFRNNAVTVASDQINIGAENEQQAFVIFNAIIPYLPLFVGLGAASPFRNGIVNGRMCNRMDVYDAAITKFPQLTGIPPKCESLEMYARELEQLPIFQHPNMLYKYSRPMPQRGVAAEIRCIDRQPTIREYMAFVALSKAITAEATNSKKYTGISGTTASRRIIVSEMKLFPDYFSDETCGATARADPRSAESSTVEDCVGCSFNEAKQFGIVNVPRERQRLNRLSRFLEPGEQEYLKPLYRRLETGSPARQFVQQATGSLTDLYRKIAAQFAAELGGR